MNRYYSVYAAPALVVVLLLGITIEKVWLRAPAQDVEPYHERVRQEAAGLPYQIGQWVGTDIEVPRGAIALLRPNVLINRRFKNLHTGRVVSMLLVQCKDARDMLGHYPPVCYPANGWVLQSSVSRDWQVDDLFIPGMEYAFSKTSLERSDSIVIDNFMVLPDGTMGRDMDSTNAIAQDYRKKYYGAAQVQLVFTGSIVSHERDEIVQAFIRSNRAIIEALHSGVENES